MAKRIMGIQSELISQISKQLKVVIVIPPHHPCSMENPVYVVHSLEGRDIMNCPFCDFSLQKVIQIEDIK